MQKKKAFYQLVANFLMWLGVPVVLAAISLAKSNSSTEPFPKDELLKLVEPKQLGIFLAAGVLYFLLFSIIRHKSKKKAEQDNATFFADLGLDEMGSALYSFGSVLLLCILIAPQWWYLMTAVACYIAGYQLKPEDEMANQIEAKP
jgi:divalent metal cation (Fe/Co/Zn/Cd) transporter